MDHRNKVEVVMVSLKCLSPQEKKEEEEEVVVEEVEVVEWQPQQE